MRYEVVCMDGQILNSNGRGYASRDGASQAANRKGLVPVETRRLGQKLPHCNDAQGWDAYRLSGGIAAR